MKLEFDYVIAGGGSAGCALASRLCEDKSITVCIVEAGGNGNNLFIKMPAGNGFVFGNPKLDWGYKSIPQKNLNNRTIYFPRGKSLGGSSIVNGMIYMRGIPSDYDSWRQLGLNGWGYSDILPYFKKAEHNEVHKDEYHGQNGPLNVCDIRHQPESCKSFVEAGSKLFNFNDDFNGAEQEGFGYYQTTQINGKRCSAAKAYLVPVLDRDNLTVMTNTQVNKILIDGSHAKGVECIDSDNHSFTLNASKEVILSSGAFGSPQILLRSGVGPANEITKHGIDHLVDLPGVGKNLQDHIDSVSYTHLTLPTKA